MREQLTQNPRIMVAYDTKDPPYEEQSCTKSIVKWKKDWPGCKSNRMDAPNCHLPQIKPHLKDVLNGCLHTLQQSVPRAVCHFHQAAVYKVRHIDAKVEKQ